MNYEQRNPIPIPASGAFLSVRSTLDSVFDWQYEGLKDSVEESGVTPPQELVELLMGFVSPEEQAPGRAS